MDVRGGTPGEENSVDGVFTDNQPPEIQDTRMIDNHILEIVFSEQMEEFSLSSSTNYFLDQGIGEPVFVEGFQRGHI